MTLQAWLTGILMLAAAVWIGGLVTLAVVATAARHSLTPAVRVQFLRDLGERYLPVGVAALAIALASGLLLMMTRPWSVASTVALLLGVALAVALTAGVGQARRMTTLRQAAAVRPDDPGLAVAVRQGATQAMVLRSGLAVLSVALLVAGLVAAA